jgi:hypothetical protein
MNNTILVVLSQPTRDDLAPATLTKIKSAHAKLRTDVVLGFITPIEKLKVGSRFYMISEPLSREKGQDQREILSSLIKKISRKTNSEYIVDTEFSTYLIVYDNRLNKQ